MQEASANVLSTLFSMRVRIGIVWTDKRHTTQVHAYYVCVLLGHYSTSKNAAAGINVHNVHEQTPVTHSGLCAATPFTAAVI